MKKIILPVRETWATSFRGAQAPAEITIATPQLEPVIRRGYPLLDNHLAWVSITLVNILRHLEHIEAPAGQLYRDAVAVRSRCEAKIAEAEQSVQRLRELVPVLNATPAGGHILVGVRKSPLATRVVALYHELDAVLIDNAQRWIDSEITDAEYTESVAEGVKILNVLAAEVNKLFREGLEVLNAFKAMKTDTLKSV